MTRRMRILLGGGLLVIMTVNLGKTIYSTFLPLKGSDKGFRMVWDGRGDPRIERVDPKGPATELQVGDEVIAINGTIIRENPTILAGDEPPPRTRITLTIRRQGELRDVVIQTVPYIFRIQFNYFILVITLFLLTGWIVFLLRPDDKQAWLLALMLATLTGLERQTLADLPSWLSLIVGVAQVLGTLFLPIFVHFFLIFPEKSPLLRRWPRLETYLYLPYLLVILPVFGPGRLSEYLNLLLLQSSWLQRLRMPAAVLITVYLAAGLVCLIINYRAAHPISRRKLRVMMAGSAAGFFNLFLLVVVEVTGRGKRFETWIQWTIFITFPLIPLSFVYAIIRHKVIPIRLIIRRGMRYVLVSRGSLLLEVLAVTLAVTALLTYVFSRLRPSGLTIGLVSSVVGIAAWKIAQNLHEKFIAPVIDRKFFRQAYDSQQIIADLAESLRTTTSLPHLMELVATKIQSALQTESVAVLLRDEKTGDYLSEYSCEYSATDGKAVSCRRQFRLPQYANAVAQLFENNHPIEIDPELNGSNGSHSVEDATLREMKSSLLLPLAGKEGVPGIISLGPRLGDVPYSREDKRLLMSVAGPTTFAIENARLVERMIEEARRRQELEAENEARARELEEARLLQLSMLPKSVPQLPHLEIAAYMKTATEVGGDYYDFHLSEDGTLTVVVGDATGHGLKAGTVVTATKSLFNHLAKLPDIPAIFHQSSQALKQMNLRSLFMAVVMVKLRGTEAACSSAGMPPILIYRAQENRVEEILIKGMPLGSVTTYPYVEHKLEFTPGDVMLLMSDGFPERFNSRGEILGYERAKEALAECVGFTPQEIIKRFVSIGEMWGDGRLQNDDITFVVLRVR